MTINDIINKIPQQYKNYKLAVEIDSVIKDVEFIKLKLSKNKIVFVLKEDNK